MTVKFQNQSSNNDETILKICILFNLPFFQSYWRIVGNWLWIRICGNYFEKRSHRLQILFTAKYAVNALHILFFANLLWRSTAHQVAQGLDSFRNKR